MRSIKSFITRHKQSVSFVALILFSILLLLITSKSIELQPKRIGQGFISIFQKAVTGISDWVGNTVNSIGELKHTKKELEEYKEQLLVYERMSRESFLLKQEIQQLRKLLHFSQQTEYKNIASEVVARQPGNIFSLITLNKGEKDGVKRYMPVVAQNHGLTGLVGKVITVSNSSCTVIPLFNEDSYVAARLEKTRYEGIVNGEGEFSDLISMQHVNKIAIRDIQYGDIVVTSGLGKVFPKGIPIGRVRSIKSESAETSIGLKIEPLIDFSRLEFVLILGPGE
jgi:rod shape-determining protein MreC